MEESHMTSNHIDQHYLEQDLPSSDSPFLGLTNTPYNSEQEQPIGEASEVELAVTQNMQALLAEMADLRRDFEAKVKYDTSKEQIIESLHRELQFHRKGLHFHILQPVFTDLILLYDDMGKLRENIGMNSIGVSDQIAQSLKVFQEVVEEILCRYGAEPFTVEGELFLPNKQRSLNVLPTSDPALDKHIARRVRQGFEYEDKLLRHELVDVYKYVLVSE